MHFVCDFSAFGIQTLTQSHPWIQQKAKPASSAFETVLEHQIQQKANPADNM